MLDRLKQLWAEAPWYIKLVLVLTGVLSVLLPKDLVHAFLNNLARKKTDREAAKLEADLKEDDQNIARAEGKLSELEKQKADVAKEETNDATDFFNTHKLPRK